MDYTCSFQSPLGALTLASDGRALTGLWFVSQKHYADTLTPEHQEQSLSIFEETLRWLELYFSGRAPEFTPALCLRGTPFRRAVWELLLSIPYGRTVTYGELASHWPRMSAQAVGGAVGHNPISLIVPCHRVLGADGSLTGYAGGVERKAWLLRHEGALPEAPV